MEIGGRGVEGFAEGEFFLRKRCFNYKKMCNFAKIPFMEGRASPLLKK